MTTSERWLRRHDHPAGAAPRVRLVCLPHAGGSAGLYQGWSRLLPAGVQQVCVQYPGRQERLGDPCVETMEVMADRVTDALLELDPLPLALFGHSMGSLVAYEVARRLEQRHGILPVRLFVSASPAPGQDRTSLPAPDDASLVDYVRRQSGSASDAYDHPELRELLLPSLRADFRLLGSYRPHRPDALRVPITALGGDRDPGCGTAELERWSALTLGGWELRSFPGGHFYLDDAAADVVDVVAERLLLPTAP